jgi:hypothetical protein
MLAKLALISAPKSHDKIYSFPPGLLRELAKGEKKSIHALSQAEQKCHT